VATRFYSALDAYQDGLRERRSGGLLSWWPSKPVWQFAVALGCLVVGLFAGQAVLGKRGSSDEMAERRKDEMAELRKEMSSMRQLVTLSLLQQQSAAERLRGVTYSYRAEPNDMEVLSALLETANQDSSVDVRLAAIDALRSFSNSSVARRGLVQALGSQNSPLTQIAVVDALTELREPSAAPVMRQLLARPDLDENVRKRLDSALRTFE
jgi:HEAT repeat protein